MSNWRRYAVAVVAIALLASIGLTEEVKLQRAVPFGILNRVFPFQYGTQTGTCFVVDLEERQYVITARHLVTGIKDGDSVRVYLGEGWQELKVKPILPEDPKTDIAALAGNRLLAPKMEIVAGDGGIFIGQDVYFLGFPFGLATRFEKPSPTQIAFIKKAILSAIDSRPGSGHILYLDGHNNPGFSGGPVIFANYSEKERLQIAGVVSGYRNQLSEVEEVIIEDVESPSGDSKKRVVRFVRENTGIVVAYSFSEITKAVKLNPVGVPIPKKVE